MDPNRTIFSFSFTGLLADTEVKLSHSEFSFYRYPDAAVFETDTGQKQPYRLSVNVELYYSHLYHGLTAPVSGVSNSSCKDFDDCLPKCAGNPLCKTLINPYPLTQQPTVMASCHLVYILLWEG